MKQPCQSVATSSGERCKKKALPGSRYCIFHADKTFWLFSATVGAILSFLIPMIWYRYIPSQELESLRQLDNKLTTVSDQYFPKLSKLEAVDELSAAMDKLEELRPKDPTQAVVTATIASLKIWHKQNPNVHIEITLQNAATPHTKKITKMLYSMLVDVGIKTHENGPYMFFPSSIAHPIAMEFASDHEHSAIDLMKCLSTYIEGATKYSSDDRIKNSIIKIQLRGVPRFTKNGKVFLE